MREEQPASTVSAEGKALFRYGSLAPIERFADVLDETRYAPVPDDWWIAACDVVMSGAAIADGRYRAVNFAGAASIAALRNALSDDDLPFVFGGDGASSIVRPSDREIAERALGATVAWVRDALGLELRAALVPVSAVRAAGYDITVARYAASAYVDYAMFSGGGLAWAEQAMKRGLYAVAPGSSETRPDLKGLSCRFEQVRNPEGIVLSLIVVPHPHADGKAVRGLLAEILAIIETGPSMGHPLPDDGPPMRWPWAGIGSEMQAAGPLAGSLALRKAVVAAHRCASFAIFRLGLKVGGFSPRRYRRQLTANADFRKYDDGLRVTAACSTGTADAIEALLAPARDLGLVDYGMHRQASAVVTCISPSPKRNDHMHFVDGGGGGYTRAAQNLKQSIG